MHPIHDIERELLFYIFELAVHTPPSELEEAADSIKPGISSHLYSTFTPLTLSHVCKAWRSLSFSLPELWSTIYVTNGVEGHIPLFALWLQNSGNHPLELIFRDADGISSKSGPAILEMVKISTEYSARWKAFKIRISRGVRLDTKAMAPFFRGLPIPQLQSLAFSFHSLEFSFNEIWKGLAQNSPVLEEMQVWGTWASLRPTISAFPFHRLTTLSLICIAVANDETLLHLSKCTSLEHLAISLSESWYTAPHLTMVALPRLAKLTLVGRLSTIEVMDNLRLPSLSNFSLHIHHQNGGHQEEAQSIRISAEKMLTRSNASLKSFTLTEAGTQFEHIWLPLLMHSSLESVEELVLEGLEENVFLDALTPFQSEDPSPPLSDIARAEDPKCPLPRLRHIHLVRMQGQVARIQSVTAKFATLKQLRSEGEFWDGSPELELVERRFRQVKANPLPEPVVNDISMLEEWSEDSKRVARTLPLGGGW
ncbi:hypothetical protein MD484_g1329, partial [Candolleomyces efflorescens]